MLRKYVGLIKAKNTLLNNAYAGNFSKNDLQTNIWPQVTKLEEDIELMSMPIVDELMEIYAELPKSQLQVMTKTLLRLIDKSPYSDLTKIKTYAAQLTLNPKLATRVVMARGPYAAKVVTSYQKHCGRVFLICQESEKNCKAVSMLHHKQVIFVKNLADRDECRRALNIIKQQSHDLDVSLVDPGYDFHSESSAASAMCQEDGLQFAGPSPEALAIMSSKIDTKAIAEQCGVPLIPGFQIVPDTVENLIKQFISLDCDILIKGDNGGGGTANFKIKKNDVEELRHFLIAKELLSADGKMVVPGKMRYFVECFITEFSHIEIQGLIDNEGAYTLEGRDCSVQRKQQKVLEIAPATHPAAKKIEADARKMLAVIYKKGYRGLLTLEFMVVKSGDEYRHHFIEINPRIQVEHTVTELLFGLDLPELKCRITSGETADSYFAEVLKQLDINSVGLSVQEKIQLLRELSPHQHAVEVRLNAQETFRNGKETEICGVAGIVETLQGDASIYTNLIPGYYLNTIAGNSNTHLICSGATTFHEAVELVQMKLRSIRIDKPTNKQFLDNMLSHILKNPSFVLNNQTIDKLDQLYPAPIKEETLLSKATAILFRHNRFGEGLDTSKGLECKERFGRISYHD